MQHVVQLSMPAQFPVQIALFRCKALKSIGKHPCKALSKGSDNMVVLVDVQDRGHVRIWMHISEWAWIFSFGVTPVAACAFTEDHGAHRSELGKLKRARDAYDDAVQPRLAAFVREVLPTDMGRTP